LKLRLHIAEIRLVEENSPHVAGLSTLFASEIRALSKELLSEPRRPFNVINDVNSVPEG